ncbi:MAG: PilZ domain-containing protein [Deltaproteobacteria bacterium]|nr:PilZ domain-containing protein [Deltaproteobacteria bacterium]
MSGWRQARTAQQKFPRQATRVAVRISTVDPEVDPDSGEPFFRSTEATTANLSRGGVFVHSWEPLSAGRRVIVALDLPSGGELSLFGNVVWTRRRLESRNEGALEAPGYGIEFVGVTRAEQAAVQQILDAAEDTRPAIPDSATPSTRPATSETSATSSAANSSASSTTASATTASPTTSATAAASTPVRAAFTPAP